MVRARKGRREEAEIACLECSSPSSTSVPSGWGQRTDDGFSTGSFLEGALLFLDMALSLIVLTLSGSLHTLSGVGGVGVGGCPS